MQPKQPLTPPKPMQPNPIENDRETWHFGLLKLYTPLSQQELEQLYSDGFPPVATFRADPKQYISLLRSKLAYNDWQIGTKEAHMLLKYAKVLKERSPKLLRYNYDVFRDLLRLTARYRADAIKPIFQFCLHIFPLPADFISSPVYVEYCKDLDAKYPFYNFIGRIKAVLASSDGLVHSKREAYTASKDLNKSYERINAKINDLYKLIKVHLDDAVLKREALRESVKRYNGMVDTFNAQQAQKGSEARLKGHLDFNNLFLPSKENRLIHFLELIEAMSHPEAMARTKTLKTRDRSLTPKTPKTPKMHNTHKKSYRL